MRTRFRRGRARLAAGSVLTVVVMGAAVVSTASPTQAHGNTNDPIARNYRCLQEWEDRWQDPAMAAQDPMCAQAWKADPHAMWNWNGLLRDGLAGRYRELVPDGTICSGGGAENGRYASLDTPGDWVATPKPSRFRLNLVDQASHGADFIDVYISRDGYDPLTERLAWDDLTRVGRTESTRDGGIIEPDVRGTAYGVDVDASAFPGRRVIMTMWKASHSDQTYFLCSDVVIGGAAAQQSGASAAAKTVPEKATQATTSPAETKPEATPSSSTTGGGQTPKPVGSSQCTAKLKGLYWWPGGHVRTVEVTAGSRPVNNWHVMLTLPDGQAVSLSWNGKRTSSGRTEMFDSYAYNSRLAAGQKASFGFMASHGGTDAPPAPTDLTCVGG